MTCPSCDFCVTDEDGALICALTEKHVHGDSTCDMWQQEFYPIDGDNFYEVKPWPEGQSRSQSF